MQAAQQSTINPAFAGHAAQQLREATDDLQRVFDNLLEIADGKDPNANTYDRLRATRVLYDRGMGKVSRYTPQTPAPRPSQPSESEESDGPTNHSSDNPGSEQGQAVKPALSLSKGADPKTAPPGTATYLVSQIEQKLDDFLGPPQTPEQPEGGEPVLSLSKGHVVQDFVPDLVRDAQHYVLEITDYGDKLKSILLSIHEPDPEDDSIRTCHRITAGQMILDRVLGQTVNLQHALDNPYDPAGDPYWAFRHPTEVDSQLTPEELKEADRKTRNFVKGMNKENDGPCPDCTDDYLCEYHDPEGELHEHTIVSEEEADAMARVIKNLSANRDRLYMDPQDGRLKIRPRNYIDDS